MAVTFIRTTIIFIALVVVMRLMGKRQIGEMQPYEFIVTLIIADLACVPMADVSIPLLYGIVSIFVLFLLHQLLALIEQGGNFFKLVISGKPSIVINKDGVDYIELRKNNMGVEDLIESMRAQGYFSLDDLDYAIFESNGKLSALPKKNKDEKQTSLPRLIVVEGKIKTENLPCFNITEDDVRNFLKTKKQPLKKVGALTIDENKRGYFQIKGGKYEIINFNEIMKNTRTKSQNNSPVATSKNLKREVGENG